MNSPTTPIPTQSTTTQSITAHPGPRHLLLILVLLMTALMSLVGCIDPVAMAATADGPRPQNVLFQTSTLSALQAGVYDGQMTVAELKGHGDFGLGTFNALDGEMIVLDGQVYQASADGTARLPAVEIETPFAAVTFFEADQHATIRGSMACADLYAELDVLLPDADLPQAIRIDGTFASLKVRAPHRESQPYPPLAEALADQAVFDHENIAGTLVGFHLPDALAGVNATGYHFHFISADRQTGGHVLDCQTDDSSGGSSDGITVQFDALGSVHVDFLQ